MIKYARVINEDTKVCIVGLGNNNEFYESRGFKQMEVELGDDGNYYLKGYLPISIEKSRRLVRINELKQLLKEYDYIGTKIATGCATIEQYEKEIELCESYREEIRKLESMD